MSSSMPSISDRASAEYVLPSSDLLHSCSWRSCCSWIAISCFSSACFDLEGQTVAIANLPIVTQRYYQIKWFTVLFFFACDGSFGQREMKWRRVCDQTRFRSVSVSVRHCGRRHLRSPKSPNIKKSKLILILIPNITPST